VERREKKAGGRERERMGGKREGGGWEREPGVAAARVSRGGDRLLGLGGPISLGFWCFFLFFLFPF
jgi:hypothetical protein